jgi:hypothetical protein
MDVAGIRHFDGVRAEDLGHELVHEEGVLGGDDVVARLQEGVADELDHFVAAAAHDDVAHFEAKLLGERVAQLPRSAVRVDVHLFDGLLHRLDGFGRGAERVLVRGQLDDVLRLQSALTRHILDGFSRFVGDEVFELRVGVIPDGHGWGLGVRFLDWEDADGKCA